MLSLTPQIAAYCVFTRVSPSYCLLNRVICKAICSYLFNRDICNYCIHFASPMIWQRCAMHCHSVPAFCAAAHWGTVGWFLCSHKDTFVPKSQSRKIKGKSQGTSRPIPHLSLNNPESQAKRKTEFKTRS